MGANREWREAHPTSRPARGYEVRYRVEGERWTQRAHGWGIDGQLPPEWGEITNTPEVQEAQIFPAYQRKWKPGNRKIVDQYSAQQENQQ